MDAAITGVYKLPTSNELRELAEPREGESDHDARLRVLESLAATSGDIDRRTAATMTAAGFALTLNGLLLKSDVVSIGVLAGLAAPALIAFLACFWCFLYWVDRGPGAEESFDNLEDAQAVCTIKQFWTLVGALMALIALEFYGFALIVLAL